MVRWANAVCSQFGCPITDLTVSFADGKAVCLLIHYYHPNLLRLHEINGGKVGRRVGVGRQTSAEPAELLKLEQANAKLAN